ncbi:hypothetical protein SLEP1_g56988 [Rubroshorea leprosula]|uniref:Uncharacterized protein n=1 Tax=Rubroshorea leprosula TaxID=152421 RepID=A0AAV5MK43_9ROSI|nr:hypothetical protein SLEP1_g56988 [Rubroshorea leprosula]
MPPTLSPVQRLAPDHSPLNNLGLQHSGGFQTRIGFQVWTRLTRKLLGLLGTLLSILVALLQIRFQSTTASPFVTHRLHFAAFFTGIVIFTVLLVIGFKLEAENSNGPATIVSTIYLYIGYLSLIPLLLIIEPYVGWTLLILWFFFVKWAWDWESFKEICDLIVSAVEPATNSLKTLFNGSRNQNEEANMSTNV